MKEGGRERWEIREWGGTFALLFLSEVCVFEVGVNILDVQVQALEEREGGGGKGREKKGLIYAATINLEQMKERKEKKKKKNLVVRDSPRVGEVIDSSQLLPGHSDRKRQQVMQNSHRVGDVDNLFGRVVSGREREGERGGREVVSKKEREGGREGGREGAREGGEVIQEKIK